MQRIQQAFRERPWLRQRRLWGTVALVTALLGIITAVDLHLSSRHIVVVRETTREMRRIMRLEIQIDEMRTEIATQASWDRIYREAEALGLQKVSPMDMVFVPVPGGLPLAATASEETTVSPQQWIRPEYRQSLLEWLWDTLLLRGGPS